MGIANNLLMLAETSGGGKKKKVKDELPVIDNGENENKSRGEAGNNNNTNISLPSPDNQPSGFDYSQYENVLNLMKDYQNREPFSYDLNADMLYQQYKNQYINNGKLAMEDTMGQAQAMSGGYANSYAQAAGQQAYNNELGKLNNIIPELYNLAYSKYAQEGNEMLQGINLANEAYNTKYNEYKDNRDFQYKVYSDELDRQQQKQALDYSNYAKALDIAQQNAGSKENISSNLEYLVNIGMIDKNTADKLSDIYGSYTVADTAKTGSYKYGDVYSNPVGEEIQNHLQSEQELTDYLNNLVENGWISEDTAVQLYGEYVDAASYNDRNTPFQLKMSKRFAGVK